MSWKDDLTNLVEQQEQVVHLLKVLQGQTVLNAKRIDALRVLMDNQIKDQNRSADRMADRMIEMAMVNQGHTTAAASHRRTLDEKPAEGADLWQDSPETQWPPPGCDAVNMP